MIYNSDIEATKLPLSGIYGCIILPIFCQIKIKKIFMAKNHSENKTEPKKATNQLKLKRRKFEKI